jgi:hypothetical protein
MSETPKRALTLLKLTYRHAGRTILSYFRYVIGVKPAVVEHRRQMLIASRGFGNRRP